MDIKKKSTETITLSVDEIRAAVEMYLKEHRIKDFNREDIQFRCKDNGDEISLDTCVLTIVKDSSDEG